MPSTLHRLFSKAHQQTYRDLPFPQPWSTQELIQACRKQGIRVYGLEEGVEHWIAGRRSVGSKGFLPVWEQSRALTLTMLGDISEKSLDELEELMVGYTQNEPRLEELTGNEGAPRISSNSRSSAPRMWSVRDFFRPLVREAGSSHSSALEEGIRSRTAGSTGSEFVPSLQNSE